MKADTPLAIDPDAMLPRSIAGERFEVIVRGNLEVMQNSGIIEEAELSEGSRLNVLRKLSAEIPKPYSFGLSRAKAPDHRNKLMQKKT
jgi:hypothetical protein